MGRTGGLSVTNRRYYDKGVGVMNIEVHIIIEELCTLHRFA